MFGHPRNGIVCSNCFFNHLLMPKSLPHQGGPVNVCTLPPSRITENLHTALAKVNALRLLTTIPVVPSNKVSLMPFPRG
jgi:hypothetical protein